MAVNSKKSLGISGTRKPKEGDQVWAYPKKVDSKQRAHFKNPYPWGVDSIAVHPSNISLKTFKTGRQGFQDKTESWLLEITHVNGSGTIYAEPVEDDDSANDFGDLEREETVHWEGTPQKAESGGTRDRSRVMKEGDIRGDLNHLL